ncbi:hypothetical protein GOBAR_DD03438 [Gossypium barbadense]|nr:hypothetical protein GOBAR_DD03438 [Gossypium barbadense]
MELVEDEDVETMVVLYYVNRSDQNALIRLFAKLVGVEPIEDPALLDNSDPSNHEVDSDRDLDVDEIRCIMIHNNPMANMSLIDPDAAHVAKFLEYPIILPAHGWPGVAQVQYRVSYRKAWIAKQMKIEQLYGYFDASYNELQGWIVTMQDSNARGRCGRGWEGCLSRVMYGMTTIDRSPNKNGFPISEYHYMYSNEDCKSKALSI